MTEIDAEIKRLELLLGVIGVEEVVAWADGVISSVDKPPLPLIDISLSEAKSPQDVAALLKLLCDGVHRVEASTAAFRRFVISRHRDVISGNVSHDRLATDLYCISHQPDFELPADYAEYCNWVDDEFALVRQGVKERESAENTLNEFVDGLRETENTRGV
jgi:hypothetical protein